MAAHINAQVGVHAPAFGCHQSTYLANPVIFKLADLDSGSLVGLQVAPGKSILVPTAEHDRVLYLRLFRDFYRLPAAIAFNSPEERILIERVTGNEGLPGEVVGTLTAAASSIMASPAGAPWMSP